MASAPTRAPLRTKAAPAEASNAPLDHANAPAGALVATSPQAHAVAHAVALPGSWKEKLAAMAKDQAAKERPSVSKISLRAGQLKYGDQPVKGNVLPCIVLLATHRNTYYTSAFDPNNLANPACFAVSVDGEQMEAHENVPNENVPDFDSRQVRSCHGCPKNEWGSDPKGGRGKACKEGRRLIILPADAIDSAEAAAKAEMAIIDIPVTSGKNYSNFVNGLAAAAGVPPWAALTDVSTQPDAKTQFKVTFTPKQVVEDEAVLEALHARMAEAERIALQPYDEVESTTAGKMAEAPAKGKSKF